MWERTARFAEQNRGGTVARNAGFEKHLLTDAETMTQVREQDGSRAGVEARHSLPQLPYDFAALEPHIDAQTMQIHHGKHHQTYITNLNTALAKHPELGETSLDELLRGISTIPEDIRAAVRNNGGGHHNHSLFWTIMAPAGKGGGEPSGALAGAIERTFGGFAKFKEQLAGTATTQFGSGWGWLTVANGKLEILGRPNQDSPLMDGKTPILGVDVWEHAYYLKYQNRRAEYITAWWNVVNWAEVARRYQAAL
jgi:superoxide dismutase, Fe-Mn family